MASLTFVRNIRKGSFTHDRTDKWWLFPLVYAIIITIFVIYTGLVLLFGTEGSTFEHYISPIFGFHIDSGFLNDINWPQTLSPAFLIIWAPLGFRATCYYERKVYYRSFFANPPACGVSGVDIRRGKYTGERWLPFVLNNFHRYFFYAALLLTIIQVLDAIIPLQYSFGIGNIILIINAVFLSLYVISCHSFRHLVGGGANCYSCGTKNSANFQSWNFISRLNRRHGTWFWISLVTVMASDFYIRLLHHGIINDIVFLTF